MVVAVLEQRAKHSGREIGAAAHGLGKNHVGRMRAESTNGVDQMGKAATEATTRNLSGMHPRKLCVPAVDQVFSLIVRYHGATQTAPLQLTCRGEDEGGFARSEKAAYQHNPRPGGNRWFTHIATPPW